jgi:hypothetical protein
MTDQLKCVECGCTDDRACMLAGGGVCRWYFLQPPLCSNPDCVAGYVAKHPAPKQDAEGREAVCGAVLGEMGLQPLMSSDPKNIEMMKPLARQLQQLQEKRIALVRFSNREEVAW